MSITRILKGGFLDPQTAANLGCLGSSCSFQSRSTEFGVLGGRWFRFSGLGGFGCFRCFAYPASFGTKGHQGFAGSWGYQGFGGFRACQVQIGS